MTKKSVTMLVVGVTIIGVIGCSSPDLSRNAYSDEFDQAMQQTESEFQKNVLHDYVITDQEYKEARNRFIECLNSAGLAAKLTDGGGYVINGAYSERVKQLDASCNKANLDEVESLYVALNENPNNEDFFELAKNCLVGKHIIDTSVSKSDIEKLFWEASKNGADTESQLRFPSGQDFHSDEVKACFTATQ